MRLSQFFIFTLFINTAYAAATNPVSWSVTDAFPANTAFGSQYVATYTFTSHLPFKMPTAFAITKQASTNEFIYADQCSGLLLNPGQSCNVMIGFKPASSGNKSLQLQMVYGNTIIPLPLITTTTQSSLLDTTWVGLIGVDYMPNHYAQTNQFNGHDVFYAGTANSNPISNTYMEMAQLKAAGFTTVRSYQTVEYSWIDIINQANALGLKVIYEALIPYNGDSTTIATAVTVLNNVITAVGVSTFQNTVSLVLAGHENYDGANISYLTSAVTNLQTALTTAGVTTPVSSALVAGSLVTPSSPSDMQKLINSYSATAPIGFDPYPFQYGVTPPNLAASSITLMNSLAWDYAQVEKQIFYHSPRAILMAETGWATQGTGQYANYYCYIHHDCAPSVANAAMYLPAVYQFVQTASNNAGVLVFEAYDEPAKDPVNPTDAENFYGMFDSNCNLKNNDVSLLPNPSYSTTSNYGCQGFTSGALLNVVGTQPGNLTNQPAFTVAVTQTNPTTSQSASYTVTVPNQDRTNANLYPWPEYLIFNNANVTITGVTSGASCSFTATVTNAAISFGSISCTNPSYLVTCSGSTCSLPWNNF